MTNHFSLYHSAILLGTSQTLLHFSAVLKTVPLVNHLGFDVTHALFALTTLLSLRQIFFQNIVVGTGALSQLILICGLALWLKITAAWSPSSEVALSKATDLTILAPAFTFFGLCLAGDRIAFRTFCWGCFAVGLYSSTVIPLMIKLNLAVLGGPLQTDFIRIQYQVAGFSIAAALCVLSSSLVLNWPHYAVLSTFTLAVLLFGILSIGARGALIAAIGVTLISPVACLLQAKRIRTTFIYTIIWLSVGSAGLLFAKHFQHVYPSFTTIQRLHHAIADEGGARGVLWKTAVAWTLPFGLGLGGFAPSAGFGDLRRWYPHNVWLESLVEGGFPGFILFVSIALNSILCTFQNQAHLGGQQFGPTIGFWFIGIIQMSFSADLGNRMIWLWFSLGAGSSVTVSVRSKVQHQN